MSVGPGATPPPVPVGATGPGAPAVPGSRDGWRPPAGTDAGPPRGSRLLEVSLVVVVVAAVVLGLLLAGVIPGLRPPPAGPGPMGFANARAQAQQAADGYGDGNWSVIAASAILPVTGVNYPLNGSPITSLLQGSGCTYTALASGSESVAGVSNVSQGNADTWLFIFRNATNALLLVSESPASVTLVGTVDGSCTPLFGFVSALPPTVIDGSTAAQSADAGGGYTFLSAHPQANGSLTVFGGVSIYGATSPPYWTVGFSDCPLAPGPATTAAAFAANVSAVSGALLTARIYTASCPAVSGTSAGGHTIAGSLVLTPVTSAPHGSGHAYTCGVVSVTTPIPVNALAVSIQSATGQPVGLADGSDLNLTSSGGVVLASGVPGPGGWTFGADTPIAAGDSFVLTTTTNLGGQGYVMVFAGTAGYSGSIVVGIP